jgi:uncharacterized membrane protein YsdA (DUF1294 family)
MRGIRIFAIAFIIYGVFNLMGLASYNDFALLCKGWPRFAVSGIYAFGILYGILGIFCGSKILKHEDWARKTAIMLVLASLLVGLFTTPVIFRNLEHFYLAKGEGTTFDAVRGSFLVSAFLFTSFELSFVFYFTRSRVKALFK